MSIIKINGGILKMHAELFLIFHSVAKYYRESVVKQADEFWKEMELVGYKLSSSFTHIIKIIEWWQTS